MVACCIPVFETVHILHFHPPAALSSTLQGKEGGEVRPSIVAPVRCRGGECKRVVV